ARRNCRRSLLRDIRAHEAHRLSGRSLETDWALPSSNSPAIHNTTNPMPRMRTCPHVRSNSTSKVVELMTRSACCHCVTAEQKIGGTLWLKAKKCAALQISHCRGAKRRKTA